MSTLPANKISDASGLYNLTRNIGGAVGLALINSSLDWLSAWHVTELNTFLTPSNAIFIERLNQLTAQYTAELGETAQQMATTIIYRDVHYQALTASFNDLLKMLSIIMFIAAMLTFLMKKPKKISI